MDDCKIPRLDFYNKEDTRDEKHGKWRENGIVNYSTTCQGRLTANGNEDVGAVCKRLLANLDLAYHCDFSFLIILTHITSLTN